MAEILCTICARGGSKGVLNKNIRSVGGKPLVGHAISDATDWGKGDDIIVSTDSDEIASVAKDFGAQVPFRRPTNLADDEAAKLPVIQHALEWMETQRGIKYDYIVDIDATTPLRKPKDIDNCYTEVIQDEQATNAYTVCEADKNPYFNMVELNDDGYARLSKEVGEEVIRRQDTPSVYEMNAAVYAYERDFLADADSIHGDFTRISIMPRERSVDIDTEFDLQFAKFLFEQREITS